MIFLQNNHNHKLTNYLLRHTLIFLIQKSLCENVKLPDILRTGRVWVYVSTGGVLAGNWAESRGRKLGVSARWGDTVRLHRHPAAPTTSIRGHRHHNRYLYTVDIRWLELAGNILALVRSRQRQARSGLYKSSKHLMKTLISMQIPGWSVVPMLLWWFLEPIISNFRMSVDCCVGKCVLLCCPRSDCDSRPQFSLLLQPALSDSALLTVLHGKSSSLCRN